MTLRPIPTLTLTVTLVPTLALTLTLTLTSHPNPNPNPKQADNQCCVITIAQYTKVHSSSSEYVVAVST